MEVKIPDDLWDTDLISEGVVSNWFYDEGATVEEGSILAVLMVEKSEFDIEAPMAGKLHIVADRDTTVVPGTVIAEIETTA